jgi:hypothetical protein
MPKNLPAQIVCPSPKVWDFNEKRLHWASVVCDENIMASEAGAKEKMTFKVSRHVNVK